MKLTKNRNKVTLIVISLLFLSSHLHIYANTAVRPGEVSVTTDTTDSFTDESDAKFETNDVSGYLARPNGWMESTTLSIVSSDELVETIENDLSVGTETSDFFNYAFFDFLKIEEDALNTPSATNNITETPSEVLSDESVVEEDEYFTALTTTDDVFEEPQGFTSNDPMIASTNSRFEYSATETMAIAKKQHENFIESVMKIVRDNWKDYTETSQFGNHRSAYEKLKEELAEFSFELNLGDFDKLMEDINEFFLFGHSQKSRYEGLQEAIYKVEEFVYEMLYDYLILHVDEKFSKELNTSCNANLPGSFTTHETDCFPRSSIVYEVLTNQAGLEGGLMPTFSMGRGKYANHVANMYYIGGKWVFSDYQTRAKHLLDFESYKVSIPTTDGKAKMVSLKEARKYKFEDVVLMGEFYIYANIIERTAIEKGRNFAPSAMVRYLKTALEVDGFSVMRRALIAIVKYRMVLKNWNSGAASMVDDFNEALEDINKALEITDNYSLLYTIKGYIAAAKAKYLLEIKKAPAEKSNAAFEVAVQALKKAIELDPDYLESYYALGKLHFEFKKYKLSETYFKKIIGLLDYGFPKRYVWLNIGEINRTVRKKVKDFLDKIEAMRMAHLDSNDSIVTDTYTYTEAA